MFTSVLPRWWEANGLVDDSQGVIGPWCGEYDFARLPAMDAPYALTDAGLLAQCGIDTFRAGGPGGQHTNRTESAVRITHLATNVVTQSQDHRDRARNQADALRRLRLRLALTIRGVSQPTWLETYRRGRQLVLGANAQHYHLVVAVALDALDQHSGILAHAAAELAVSSSQFTKLLTADKEVHAAANTVRAKHGQGTIRA